MPFGEQGTSCPLHGKKKDLRLQGKKEDLQRRHGKITWPSKDNHTNHNTFTPRHVRDRHLCKTLQDLPVTTKEIIFPRKYQLFMLL